MSAEQERIKVLTSILKDVIDNGPKGKECLLGLCTLIQYKLNDYYTIDHYITYPSYKLLKKAMYEVTVDWEHYSGDSVFPIQHPDIEDSEIAYDINKKWVGEYGERRIELTKLIYNHLINIKE